jgi:hypothetical protein
VTIFWTQKIMLTAILQILTLSTLKVVALSGTMDTETIEFFMKKYSSFFHLMVPQLTTGFGNEGCEKIFLAILLASNSCFHGLGNLLHIAGVLNFVAH